MALKDPPSYVGLDPALIYGVHDLKRITYQRLLQLIGWMWVTRKTGNPLGATIAELADRWEIAERTVYHTLQTLAEKGYIEVVYHNTRVHIRKGQRCTTYNNTPGEPATQQQVAGGDTQQTMDTDTIDNRSREATHNTPGEPATEGARASWLHETEGEPEERCTGDNQTLHQPNTNSSVVVVGSNLEDQEQPQQPISKSAVQLSMETAGMFEDKAAELTGDPWVTDDRVARWIRTLMADDTIRSVGAVLYSNLKAHREPPPKKEPESTRRFIEGEYADFVEH